MKEINQAIFMTNTFAKEYPDVHVQLWKEFEQAVPFSQRSGYYGADNVAYIRFLKQKKHPVFVNFFSNNVEARERGAY